MVKNLLLIVNPTSGTMRSKQQLLNICKTFCDADYGVSVHITRCRGDATRCVEERGNQFDVIVSCGGDGTFHEVVNGAAKIDYAGEIGFLPCGTTNDFAQTLQIPKNIAKASLLITYEKAKFLDFASFNKDSYFTYVASFGAFTDVAYSTDQKWKQVFGHAAYVTEALARLKDLRSYSMRISCDGEVYEDEFLFGAVANTLSIGGVMKLKKDQVDLRDGFHEVLLIRNPKKTVDFANLSRELLSGNFENKSVLLFRGKKIVFECDEAIPWCVDGEYADDHKKVVIRTLHNRLRVLYP